MLDFDALVMRHGECWVQDLVERLERYEGLRAEEGVLLEDRWAAVMRLPVVEASGARA
ncbi:MAG: hypothetical protein ABTQ34_04515 [Bdellovibrionales bacterium]